MSEPTYSVHQAAQILGRHDRWVHDHSRAHTIGEFEGRALRFRAEHIYRLALMRRRRPLPVVELALRRYLPPDYSLP